MNASRHLTGVFGCLLAFLLVISAHIGEAGAQVADQNSEWTSDDILLAESAGQYRVSPDGEWVVWVKTTVSVDKGGRVSNLFLSSLTKELGIQLTRGDYSHSAPRWSPDGQSISFMSSRPLHKTEGDASSSQLWLINPSGGEPWPLTSFERGIRSYEWKDGDTIVFTAEEDASLYERDIKKNKDTSRVVDDEEHVTPVRLFSFSVNAKQVTRLTDNVDRMGSFALSPNGNLAMTLHNRSLSYGYDQRVPPVTYLWNLETGEGREVFDGSRIIPGGAQWAKDGAGFYFLNDSTTHPRYREATISLLMYYDVASGVTSYVDLDWARGAGFGYSVTSDGVVALLQDGVRFKAARYTKRGDGWRRSWIEGEHAENIFGFDLGEDGETLVYSYSTASIPTQLYRGQLRGTRVRDEVKLTDLNPGYKKKTMPRTEIVQWMGALDEEVEGVLYYPLGYVEGERYPLILLIHGGPAGTDRDSWTLTYTRPMPLLNQKGAFVLRANYHGSGGYGLDWVESICCGNYYKYEIPDLENGVDYLIERGLADPDKLATMGWSNGAILSIELTTRTDRYKAASSGAGDVEWISDWANVDFGAAFDNYYFGAAPYEDPQRYIDLSPFFRMENVTTPTIIYFGTEDRNVPTDQGWSHFRALQQIGKAPVKFILFPGESHGIRKLQHQRRKLEEDLAWFDMYLFETYEPKNESFKKGSPLAEALQLIDIARADGYYGLQFNGSLVPEVVEYKGLEIGRFEVTRGQYAAFDDSYAYEPGTGNYPANDVKFDEALAYAAWLSELTGDLYRLGSAAEMKAIYESAGGKGNTLDYWAGYTLNPDDAAELAVKVAELPGDAPLLKAVGSFPGSGKAKLVFDLGGNVAEWVVDAGGGGELIGGSADLPADNKVRRVRAGEAYRGFRIVRGGSE